MEAGRRKEDVNESVRAIVEKHFRVVESNDDNRIKSPSLYESDDPIAIEIRERRARLGSTAMRARQAACADGIPLDPRYLR